MQSTPATLEKILARHEWISTFTHPPDVTFLLRTNDAPSPLQSAGLKASLESVKTARAELQSDLDLLHDATAVLQSQMSRLQSFEDDYKAALSPIRRIPPEITMEIVRRSRENENLGSCYPGRHVFGFNVFTAQEGPWHLGQVCRSWRNVIETFCPELWAVVAVDIPLRLMLGTSLKVDALVEMLRVVLERSRNHPLDFYLELYDAEAGALQTKVMERCFHILVAHSNRWRAIEIVVPPVLLPQLSLIRGKTECLRDIYIYCSRAQPQSGDIHAFEIAPKLEKLYFKGLPLEANIHFPVGNLVSFSDERPFAGDRWTPKYLDIIRSAPKLRSFSYNDYGIGPISTPFSVPGVMSRSVEELSASSPSFMRRLVLPSLKGFTLTTGCDIFRIGHELIKCPVDALSALHKMLVQSQCFLTRLHLIDVVLNDDLANIIRLVPGLQDFVIKFHEWEEEYDPIMVSLVRQLSETTLVDGSLQHTMVPSLQELGIYLYSLHYIHISFLDFAFVDMVASRVRCRSDARRLARLDLLVRGSGWNYELNEVALNSLRGEGLELHFSRFDGDPGIDFDE